MNLLSDHQTKLYLEQIPKAPIATIRSGHLYERLTDRQFEILLYYLFKSKIENNEVQSKYDEACLMQGVGDDGIDVLLRKERGACGVIQCKHSSNPAHKWDLPTVAKEIIKFVLHYLIDGELISELNSFTYYIAVSGDVYSTVNRIVDDSSQIPNDNRFPQWVSSVIASYEAFKNLSIESVQGKLTAIITGLNIKKITRTDLEYELAKDLHKHVANAFFDRSSKNEAAKRSNRYRNQLVDRFAKKIDKYVVRDQLIEKFLTIAHSKNTQYITVISQAGSGKTSFMYWLVENINSLFQELTFPAVIYYFIEHNRSTAISSLQGLNTQILTLLTKDEELEQGFESLSIQFNSILQALCNQDLERPIYILIDEFDELDTEEQGKIARIFPAVLPPNLTVVISSKPTPELFESFGWDHEIHRATKLTISEFSIHEIESLLAKFQAPPKSEANSNHSLATRIYDVTKGHALWTRAVCKDVAQLGIRQLESLENESSSDFIGYISQQMRKCDLKEGSIAHEVLGILSVCYAPLALDELAALVNKPRMFVRESLNSVSRLVEEINGRYFLFHRLVQEYLQLELFANDLARFETRIIEWGRTFLDAGWPKETPEYLIGWFVQHLVQAKDVDYLLDLLRQPSWTHLKHFGTEWGESLMAEFDLASTKVLDNFSSANWNLSIALLLRKIALEISTRSVSDDEILFLAKVGKIERAYTFSSRNHFSFDVSIQLANEVANSNPNRALRTLEDLVNKYSGDIEIDNAVARLRVAITILKHPNLKKQRNALLYAERVKDQALELLHLLQKNTKVTISKMEDIVAYWLVPLLVLTNEMQLANDRLAKMAMHNQIKANCRVSKILRGIDEDRADAFLKRALDVGLDEKPYLELQIEIYRATLEWVSQIDDLRTEDKRKRFSAFVEQTETLANSDEARKRIKWSEVVKQIARLDIAKARKLVISPEGKFGALLDDSWGSYILELASRNLELALEELSTHFSNWISTGFILGEIIGSIAKQPDGLEEAQKLIKQYENQWGNRFERGKNRAYLRIAEAYLVLGNKKKAEELFNMEVLPVTYQDRENVLFNLVGAFFGACSCVDDVDPEVLLSQFNEKGLKDDREHSIFMKIGWIAAKQKQTDFLEKHRRDGAIISGAVQQMTPSDPELAREYLAPFLRGHDGGMSQQTRKWLETNLLIQECVNAPENIEQYLKHFISNDGKSPHHMCSTMAALPHAIGRIIQSNNFDIDHVTNVIEKMFEVTLNWRCDREDWTRAQLFGDPCECTRPKNEVLCYSVGIMARLNFDRALAMANEISKPNLRLTAMRHMLINCEAKYQQTLVEDIRSISEDEYRNSPQNLVVALLNLFSFLEPDDINRKRELLNKTKHLVTTEDFEPPLHIKNAAYMRLFSAEAKIAQTVDEIFKVASDLSKESLGFREYHSVLDVCTDFISQEPKDVYVAYLVHLHQLALRQSNREFVQAVLVSAAPLAEKLSQNPREDFWETIDLLDWVYREIPDL